MSIPIKYINAGPMQAQASASAAMAPGQALENVGNAIAQTGAMGLNVLERVRKVRDTGTSAAFMAQAEEEADRFALSLAKRSDTDAWPQEWKHKADSLREKAKNLPLSSEGMASLDADLVGWHGKKAIQFETQAVSKELTIGHARITQNLAYNTARVDKASFDRDLNHAVEAGIYNPAETEAAQRNFQAQEARIDIERMVTGNPSGFVDMPATEFLKHVSGSTMEMIEPARRMAEKLDNRNKAELWDNILNKSIEGDIIPAAELKKLAEEGTISPEQRASYLAAHHRPSPPVFDATLYEDAFSVISRYDSTQDPSGATLAQLRGQLGTLPLPKESLQELSKRLTDRATPPRPEAKKRHRLEGDFQSRTDQHFEDGKFGNWFKWDLPRDTTGNAIPGKEQTKIIRASDWSKALSTKRRFLDQWDAYLENSPEGIDPAEAEKTYQAIFEKVVLDSDDALPTGGGLPPAPRAVEFDDIDGLLGAPDEPPTNSKLPAQSSNFGGVPILPPGRFYQNAKPTVFGGTNDPADNGLSAFGGTTGAGGKEGVAIPHDVLKATFPGKDKAWFEKNVRVAVRTADGRKAVMPVADLGTAEWVWEKNGRPTLDLTPGALKQLGGSVIYDSAGKITGVRGIENLSFALTTDNAGVEADLSQMSWGEASASWFKDKRPTAPEQIASGLAALRRAWNTAQMKEIDPGESITDANLKTAAEASDQ